MTTTVSPKPPVGKDRDEAIRQLRFALLRTISRLTSIVGITDDPPVVACLEYAIEDCKRELKYSMETYP